MRNKLTRQLDAFGAGDAVAGVESTLESPRTLDSSGAALLADVRAMEGCAPTPRAHRAHLQRPALHEARAVRVVEERADAVEEKGALVLARRRFGDGRGRRVRPHRVGPRRHVDVVDPVGPKARFIL